MTLWNPKAVWKHSTLCALLAAVALLFIAFYMPSSAPPPLANAASTSGKATEHIVPGTIATIDGTGNYSHVGPGDRLLVRAGNRGALRIRNLQGNPDAPITIVNYGGPVRIRGGTRGIRVENSEHIHITGTGDPTVTYGFDISGFSNSGVTVYKGTQHIEIDHLEVHHSDSHAAGFRIGSLQADVPNGWVQHNTHLHHCYIHDVTTEAIYAGHGLDQKNPGAPMKNLEINHCRIERCGWDGIQVRNVPDGANIHNNTIQDVGSMTGGTTQGGAGLIIGHSTGGEWHNNVVINADRGIQLLDHQADVKIYRNLFVHCGYVRDGGGIIWFTSKPAIIHHNTIVDSNAYGIRVKSSVTRGEIRDNIVAKSRGTLIEASVPKPHNLQADSLSEVKFVAPERQDYNLQSDSPARGAGSDGQDVGAFPYKPQPTPTPQPQPQPQPKHQALFPIAAHRGPGFGE